MLSTERPLVMGIINVTPDSFSDGGTLHGSDDAVARAETQLAEGADTIRDLAVLSSADFSSVHEAVGRVTEILARNRWAVPFAVVYLKDAEGHLAAVSQYGLPVPTDPHDVRVGFALTSAGVTPLGPRRSPDIR